jgi:hypothetical protein
MAPFAPRAQWPSHLQPFATMRPIRMRSPVDLPSMPAVMKPGTNLVSQPGPPQPGFSGFGFGAAGLGFVPGQDDIRAKLTQMQQSARPAMPQGVMQQRIGVTVPTVPGLGGFGAGPNPYATMRSGNFPSLSVSNPRADVNQVEQIVRGLNPVVG